MVSYIEFSRFVHSIANIYRQEVVDLVTRFGERELLPPLHVKHVRLDSFSDSLDSRDFKGSSDDEEEKITYNKFL